jgi:hypothetical protein
MAATRTIFAALIALSVAALPMGGRAMASVQPAEQAMSAALHDCCPPAPACDEGPDDAACIASCALNCFFFSAVSVSNPAFAMPERTIGPLLVSQVLDPQTGSPPFRPPRR